MNLKSHKNFKSRLLIFAIGFFCIIICLVAIQEKRQTIAELHNKTEIARMENLKEKLLNCPYASDDLTRRINSAIAMFSNNFADQNVILISSVVDTTDANAPCLIVDYVSEQDYEIDLSFSESLDAVPLLLSKTPGIQKVGLNTIFLYLKQDNTTIKPMELIADRKYLVLPYKMYNLLLSGKGYVALTNLNEKVLDKINLIVVK